MEYIAMKEGVDWESTDTWPVVTRRELEIKTHIKGIDAIFLSNDKPVGRLISDGRLRIYTGYACDGYSPVLHLFGRYIRLTPTPKCGMFPAILHDFLRQFLPVKGCPWDRKRTDDLFYNALAGGGQKTISSIYHGAVAGKAGDMFIRLTRKTCSELSIKFI